MSNFEGSVVKNVVNHQIELPQIKKFCVFLGSEFVFQWRLVPLCPSKYPDTPNTSWRKRIKTYVCQKTKEEEGFDKQVSLLLFMTQREQTKQNDQEPSTALDDYCESFVFA